MSAEISNTAFLEYFFEEYKILVLLILGVLIWLFIRPDFWRRLLNPDEAGDGTIPNSDPIAEADFYLAYGKYDEAGQVLRRSIATEAPTADLMHKLLEVYFADRKGDEFLSSANYYIREYGRHGHWDRICEMGRELLPDEKLFR